jgi:hypothetical protein
MVKRKNIVIAKGTAKEVSTATLIIDEGGQFSNKCFDSVEKGLYCN